MTQFVAFFELLLEAMHVPRRLRLRSSWSSGSRWTTPPAPRKEPPSGSLRLSDSCEKPSHAGPAPTVDAVV